MWIGINHQPPLSKRWIRQATENTLSLFVVSFPRRHGLPSQSVSGIGYIKLPKSDTPSSRSKNSAVLCCIHGTQQRQIIKFWVVPFQHGSHLLGELFTHQVLVQLSIYVLAERAVQIPFSIQWQSCAICALVEVIGKVNES